MIYLFSLKTHIIRYHIFYKNKMIYIHDILANIYLIDTDYKKHKNPLGSTEQFDYILPKNLIIKDDVNDEILTSYISDSIERIIFNKV